MNDSFNQILFHEFHASLVFINNQYIKTYTLLCIPRLVFQKIAIKLFTVWNV